MLRYVQTTKQILIEEFGYKDISTDKKKSVLESPTGGHRAIILPNGDVQLTTGEGVTLMKYKAIKKRHINVPN